MCTKHLLCSQKSFPADLIRNNIIGGPIIKLRQYPQNQLTNRFSLGDEGVENTFPTNAIFNVDDDMAIDCRLMSAAFRVWWVFMSHTLLYNDEICRSQGMHSISLFFC